MTHLKQISKNLPAKAESMMEISQKVAIFADLAEAIGTLAESIGAWLGLIEDEE